MIQATSNLSAPALPPLVADRRRTRPRIRWRLGLFILVLVGAAATVAMSRRVPPPAAAAVVADERVAGLGRLEPRGGVVTLAAPYGSSDAPVSTVLVREGDDVDPGALVAVMGNEASLRAAVRSAEADVAARIAVLEQTRRGTKASRGEAMASLSRAKAARDLAATEAARLEALHDRGAATAGELDRQNTAHVEAMREVERAEATVSRYAKSGKDVPPDVAVAMANLAAAEAALDRAKTDLERAYVRSPLRGVVLDVHVEHGERPSSEGIVTLGDVEHMTARIEIHQSDIRRVQVGAFVDLVADAIGVPLAGRVERVGLEVRKQALVDTSPAANTDARVVEVIVALDEASASAARGFTNLQVLARIEGDPQR